MLTLTFLKGHRDLQNYFQGYFKAFGHLGSKKKQPKGGSSLCYPRTVTLGEVEPREETMKHH